MLWMNVRRFGHTGQDGDLAALEGSRKIRDTSHRLDKLDVVGRFGHVGHELDSTVSTNWTDWTWPDIPHCVSNVSNLCPVCPICVQQTRQGINNIVSKNIGTIFCNTHSQR